MAVSTIKKSISVETVSLAALTTASNVTIRTATASKFGQVVCLNLVIDINASKTEGATLISNVPNEILPTSQTDGAHNGTPARLDTSGNIMLSAAASAKTWNRITFTYITNN